ncbi:MAG: saccharopine dehydrogenase NADP-binding domain-containing protein [Planctomycetaceae bacterium]
MCKVPFDGRILVIGFGSVSQCTLPLLLRHIDIPAERITVLDFADCRDLIAPYVAQGVRFVSDRIRPGRLPEQLAALVGPGDMIVDLAWNIDCGELLDWCRRNDVRYVNTSIEVWDPYAGKDVKTPPERTLYARHMRLRRLFAGWSGGPGATAILDHGANPGLVSHFTKQALIDIAQRLLVDKASDLRRPLLERALADGQFNVLAQALRVRSIHISERDTQVSHKRRRGNEFVNTWSVEGFYEEGIAPAEMGWGTHERALPADAWEHLAGPRNQICLARFGMNTFVRSRVASSEILGMVIRHGEAFSISDHLTVTDADGRVAYRPTVHYAYLPCEFAVASLDELREQNYRLHETWRIMTNDITRGYDELGVLLMGHDYCSWWCGTILDIDEARRLVPGQNATTVQVASSVLAAVRWMIRNPRRGVLLPDDLPHTEILEVARPYLGQVLSIPIDWTPLGTGAQAGVDSQSDETWQFGNFLLEPMSGHLSLDEVRRPHLIREFCDPLSLERLNRA